MRHRDLENYLWDDEILRRLCHEVGQPEKIAEILALKSKLLDDARSEGRPEDDVKAVSGTLYVRVKQLLKLTQRGNTADEFCRSTLAPLVTPDTVVYKALESDIFGVVP